MQRKVQKLKKCETCLTKRRDSDKSNSAVDTLVKMFLVRSRCFCNFHSQNESIILSECGMKLRKYIFLPFVN